MAAGSSQTFLLLAVLVLGLFADPCESQELRCQCIQTHSDFIPSKSISNVQLIPAGAYCSRKEIIITQTDGKLVCLDPEAEWVMTVIGEILDRPTLNNKKEVCLDPEAPLIKKIIEKILSRPKDCFQSGDWLCEMGTHRVKVMEDNGRKGHAISIMEEGQYPKLIELLINTLASMLNLLSPKDLNLHRIVVTHNFGSQCKVEFLKMRPAGLH